MIEYTWIERQGRDRDGDKYDVACLVHTSGRIMAEVTCPLAHEFMYRVKFHTEIPDAVLKRASYGDFHFIDLKPAQTFAMDVVVRGTAQDEKDTESEQRITL